MRSKVKVEGLVSQTKRLAMQDNAEALGALKRELKVREQCREDI